MSSAVGRSLGRAWSRRVFHSAAAKNDLHPRATVVREPLRSADVLAPPWLADVLVGLRRAWAEHLAGSAPPCERRWAAARVRWPGRWRRRTPEVRSRPPGH